MSYPDYIIHYNKNHSKSNGQFVSGDGDGDGIANDHANQKKREHRNAANMRTNGKKMLKKGIIMKGVAKTMQAASFVSGYMAGKVSDKETYGKLGLSFISNTLKVGSIPLDVVGTVNVVGGAVNLGRGNARLSNLEKS